MISSADYQKITHWLQHHAALFLWEETSDAIEMKELYSGKSLKLKKNNIEKIELKANTLNSGEDYVVLLLSQGNQLVLASQGFVFPPDFTNTGPMTLPSPVYCLQDFAQLFHRLQHLAAEAERQREAVELIMVLIAILDGAKGVGLDVEAEAEAVEKILSQLERGEIVPHFH